jgi:acyl-CoA synthetase (AMP-forming)/AMP-acid ligase II
VVIATGLRAAGDDVGRAAALIAERCPEGRPVVLASVDDAVGVTVLAACLLAGRPLLPLDPRAPAAEVRGAIDDGGLFLLDPLPHGRWELPADATSLLVRSRSKPTAWERLMRRRPDVVATFPGCLDSMPAQPPAAWPPLSAPHDSAAPALILRTSGSTGRPRLVVLHRGALAAQIGVLQQALQVDAQSRILNLLPFDHIDGLVMGALLALESGTALLRPDEAGVPGLLGVRDQVYRERASHLILVPPVLSLLLRDGDDLADVVRTDSFRTFVSTAAPLPDPLWQQVEGLTGRSVVNVYGLTETGNLAFSPPVLSAGRHGTVGALRGCEWKLVDADGASVPAGSTGTLLLRGPTVARELWGGAPLVDEAGWYDTGDSASLDDSGALRIDGRVRSQVSIGGLKVDPLEVENVLRLHPLITDAAVAGEADPVWGDRLVAIYVGEGLDEQAAADWLRLHLSEYKVPRSIERREALDRGPTGKIRAAAAGGRARVSDQVLDLAAEVFRVPRASLSVDQGPDRIPGWDSMGHLDLVLRVEAHFGLRLGPRDLAGLRTLGDAVRMIEAMRAG